MPQDTSENLLKQVRQFDKAAAKDIKSNKMLESNDSIRLRSLLVRSIMRNNDG